MMTWGSIGEISQPHLESDGKPGAPTEIEPDFKGLQGVGREGNGGKPHFLFPHNPPETHHTPTDAAMD